MIEACYYDSVDFMVWRGECFAAQSPRLRKSARKGEAVRFRDVLSVATVKRIYSRYIPDVELKHTIKTAKRRIAHEKHHYNLVRVGD